MAASQTWTVFILLISTFTFQCTAPAGWQSSYLYSSLPQNSSSHSPRSSGTERRVNPNGEKVRVKIYEGESKKITASSWQFLPQGKKEGAKKGSGDFLPNASGVFESENGKFSFNGREYYGKMLIFPQSSGKVLFVNYVDEQDYLTSVVAHEMSPDWPLEALKAQAVLARTYLANQLEKADSARKYDIDSSTKNQVYGGVVENETLVRQAVEDTGSEMVYYQDSLASVFYHSCSGGYTASAGEVWGRDVPYLVSRKSDFCTSVPVENWNVTMGASELGSALQVGTLQDVRVVQRSPSHRVILMEVRGSRGKKEISGDDFRKRIGATKIKSTLFDARVRSGKVEIVGKGYGHGVGLSQWGANCMAKDHGKNYKDILSFYFPGTSIGSSSF